MGSEGGGGFSTSFSDITGALGDLFGTGTSTGGTTSGTTTSEATQTERLTLDEAAVQKIIEDVLGGADGLASIFSGEQVAGVFDSSVSAQAAGNLASKLVGELAKLTAEKETAQTGTQTTRSQQQQQQEAGGLLDPITEGIASVFGF